MSPQTHLFKKKLLKNMHCVPRHTLAPKAALFLSFL
jgi:hypothetical protein